MEEAEEEEEERKRELVKLFLFLLSLSLSPSLPRSCAKREREKLQVLVVLVPGKEEEGQEICPLLYGTVNKSLLLIQASLQLPPLKRSSVDAPLLPNSFLPFTHAQ